MAENVDASAFSASGWSRDEEIGNQRFSINMDSSKTSEISLDDIAVKLLRDNFLLTALELHAELAEVGKELPRLRDFFSNPGNFEHQLASEIRSENLPGLPRTASVQTFDSLDFARYSDDGDRQVDERVAVLEFELRKAKETIRSLRANLTEAAESEVSTPDTNLSRTVVEEGIKSHEKRALNYLVNEYLLKHNYKLTSITFSDENEDQDFEDWDDVGLNTPRPPPLLHMYRDFGRHFHCGQVNGPGIDEQTQVELILDDHAQVIRELEDTKTELTNRILVLEKQVLTLCNENATITSDYDYLKSVVSELHEQPRPPVTGLFEFDYNASTESEKPVSDDKNYNMAPASWPDLHSTSRTEADGNETLSTVKGLSPSEAETRRLSLASDSSMDTVVVLAPGPKRNMPVDFRRALLEMCYAHKDTRNNRLSTEVAEVINDSEKVILMLARCLPHIVPNVILAKREELIPVILCTIGLHPDPKERDKLLNILFNLIKRPNDEQRQMILTGFVAIAQHLGPSRVESELLPQCWEQINHRYPERRLLVAESCGVLIPYLLNEIRSSLILSMLQQILQDDKMEVVRVAAIKSLAVLVAYIEDVDKYAQILHLTMSTLTDDSERVCHVGLKVLMPSMAAWSHDLQRLENDLVDLVLKAVGTKIRELPVKSVDASISNSPASREENVTVSLVQALDCLLPWIFVSLVESGPFATETSEQLSSTPIVDVQRFSPSFSPLVDVTLLAGSEARFASLLHAYEGYISQEWFQPWEKFDWLTRSFVPNLIQQLVQLSVSYHYAVQSFVQLFRHMCLAFGKHFTQTRVKPLFHEVLQLSGDDTDVQKSSQMTALLRGVVPVYAAGVLAAFDKNEDNQELSRFLQELLYMLPLCRLPLDSIRATVVELRNDVSRHDMLLTVLWEGVVHTSALVRTAAVHLFQMLVGFVSETLLATRVAPALVTLASDPEMSVRIATVSAFGSILETTTHRDLIDKAQLQFHTFLDDPLYRDQLALHIQVIRTFSRVGPNSDQRFRDDFILPHLTAFANFSNYMNDDTKKTDLALALMEAFSALSCCVVSEQLTLELILPGLRCLHATMQQIFADQEHADVVASMIRECEVRVEAQRVPERSNSLSNVALATASMDDMRSRVSKMFATKTTGRANIQSIFQIRKK